MTSFWETLDQLVAGKTIILDRPKGSHHPRYPDFVYPYDYGYLAGTHAQDGGGLDLWLGSLPERSLSGVILAADSLKQDVEIKLLLGCTEEEICAILAIHQEPDQSAILIRRREGA